MVHKKRAKLHPTKRNRNKKLNDRFRANKPVVECRPEQIIRVIISEREHNFSYESKATELNSTGKPASTNINIGASLRYRCSH
jgi:hypothetical protein